jgi:hypothetical protein
VRRTAWALALGAACGCAHHEPARDGAPPASPTPPQSIVVHSRASDRNPVRFFVSRQGRRVYAVSAEANVSRQSGEGSGRSDFVNPHVKFYDRNGTTLFADSPAATASERERSIVMTGGVQAYTSTGIRLSCRTLAFDDRTQRLHGEGDVVMTTPRGDRLSGDRIDADTRLSQVHISGGGST